MKIVADAHIPFVNECFSSLGEVETVPPHEISKDHVASADVLLVRALTPVNATLLHGSRIKFVATVTTGVNHIDQQYLRDNGIGFVSAPGANANSVADYVVAALLSIAKKHNLQLKNKSIGIIGVGRIGSRIEKRAKSIGMEVYLNDPPLQRKTGNPKYLPIEKLNKCDFITLHTPLIAEGNDRTFHLFDAEFFESLKSKVIFINSSRGEVVDTDALKQAIRKGRLRGTVIDVWENEPDIDTELVNMVDLATPHIAGLSIDGRAGGMFMAYMAMCKYFGFEVSISLDDLLPPPEVPQINLDDKLIDEWDVISTIVSKVYNINNDNYNMRKILSLPVSAQGVYFDQMRDNYSIRRDFHNTKIVIKNSSSPLAAKIKDIGFETG